MAQRARVLGVQAWGLGFKSQHPQNSQVYLCVAFCNPSSVERVEAGGWLKLPGHQCGSRFCER